MVPTVRVPPTRTVVCYWYGNMVTNGDAGYVPCTVRRRVPPPLPVRVDVVPDSTDITVPGFALI